jgi:hypothetical protein
LACCGNPGDEIGLDPFSHYSVKVIGECSCGDERRHAGLDSKSATSLVDISKEELGIWPFVVRDSTEYRYELFPIRFAAHGKVAATSEPYKY